MPIAFAHFARHDDRWLLNSPTAHQSGDVIDVRRRNGNNSRVRVTSLVAEIRNADDERRWLYNFENVNAVTPLSERLIESYHVSTAWAIAEALSNMQLQDPRALFLRFPELTSTGLGLRVWAPRTAAVIDSRTGGFVAPEQNRMLVTSHALRNERRIVYGQLDPGGMFLTRFEDGTEVTRDIVNEIVYILGLFQDPVTGFGLRTATEIMNEERRSLQRYAPPERSLMPPPVRPAPPRPARNEDGSRSIFDPVTGTMRTVSREASAEVGFTPGAMRPRRQRAQVQETDETVTTRTGRSRNPAEHILQIHNSGRLLQINLGSHPLIEMRTDLPVGRRMHLITLVFGGVASNFNAGDRVQFNGVVGAIDRVEVRTSGGGEIVTEVVIRHSFEDLQSRPLPRNRILGGEIPPLPDVRLYPASDEAANDERETTGLSEDDFVWPQPKETPQ